MFKVYKWYKLSHYLYEKKFRKIAKIITFIIRFVFNAYIPAGCQIGEGTAFGYGALGIVIHDRAVIGYNCLISQNVTIGGTTKKYEVPVIGNSVYVGAGAKVLGPIVVGNNCVIGANAVVISDIPDNSLVVGVPAKVIKQNININDYL